MASPKPVTAPVPSAHRAAYSRIRTTPTGILVRGFEGRVYRTIAGAKSAARYAEARDERNRVTRWWTDMLRDYTAGRLVVIGGRAWLFGEERRELSSFGRFGNDSRTVYLADGTARTTTALWDKGVVPADWRDRLADNASLTDAFAMAAK